MIVTPGKTVQSKTVQNFTEGSPRFIPGAAIPPAIVTPQDYSAWVARTNGQVNFAYGHEISMLAFIFNIPMSRLKNGENVSTAALIKICDYLNCEISDICELERTETRKEVK